MHEIDIGDLGETDVAATLQRQGFTINNSKSADRFGWDLLVEIPNLMSDAIPVDKQKSRNIAMLQIKTTRSNELSRTIKLSNAQHMATQELPTFIILVQLNDSNLANKIFAKHIWQPEISSILKRLRQSHAKAKGNIELHKQKITINFSTDDEKTTDLASFVKNTIDAYGDEYAAKKREILSSEGYSDSKGKITFRYEGSISELVDWQIGKKKAIRIRDWRHFDTRFGIEVNLPNQFSSKGELELTPTPQETVARFTFADDAEIKIKAELFVPNLPGIPVEHFKYRLRFDAMEILVGNQIEKVFTFNINFEKKCDTNSIKLIASFLNPEKGKSISAAINVQGREEFLFEGLNFTEKSQVTFASPPIDILPIIQVLERISDYSLENDLKFSYSDVESVIQTYDVVYFNCITRNMKIIHQKRIYALKKIEFLYYFAIIPIKEMEICTIFKSKVSKVSFSRQKTNIFIDVPKVIAVHVGNRQHNNDAEIKRMFLDVAKRNSDNCNSISLGNVFDYISSAIRGENKFMYMIDSEYVDFLINTGY